MSTALITPRESAPASSGTGACVAPAFRSVPAQRVLALQKAVELGVDVEDIVLESGDEADLWQELTAEFDLMVERLGPVWVAD